MTYQKKGAEFADECAYAGLTDAAYRTHDEAILWLYQIENYDMRIPKHLVRRFAGSGQWQMAVVELVKVGFWRDVGDAYVVDHHSEVIRQGLVAQQRSRETSKRTSARHRAKQKASADVTDDVTRHVTPNTDRQTNRQTPGREESSSEGDAA